MLLIADVSPGLPFLEVECTASPCCLGEIWSVDAQFADFVVSVAVVVAVTVEPSVNFLMVSYGLGCCGECMLLSYAGGLG